MEHNHHGSHDGMAGHQHMDTMDTNFDNMQSHDHGAHVSSSGMPGMDHMMKMYFHGGYNEVILFDFWRINSLGGLIGSMIGCFLLGVLYEGIKFCRESWMRGAFQKDKYNRVSNF